MTLLITLLPIKLWRILWIEVTRREEAQVPDPGGPISALQARSVWGLKSLTPKQYRGGVGNYSRPDSPSQRDKCQQDCFWDERNAGKRTKPVCDRDLKWRQSNPLSTPTQDQKKAPVPLARDPVAVPPSPWSLEEDSLESQPLSAGLYLFLFPASQLPFVSSTVCQPRQFSEPHRLTRGWVYLHGRENRRQRLAWCTSPRNIGWV